MNNAADWNTGLESGEAIYQGQVWNVRNLKPNGEHYDAELWKRMKKESQDHQFFCPECGENLILCAGKIVEPYFKHYDGSECVFSNADVYRKSYQTRGCLTELVRRSFPDAEILTYAQIPKSRFRSQILVRTRQFTMALNYAPDNIRIKHLEAKIEALRETGYIPVWFCEYKPGRFERNSVVQNLILETQPVLKFVDTSDNRLYLKKEARRGDYNSMMCESYPLIQKKLNMAGEFPDIFLPENRHLVMRKEDYERLEELEYGRKIYELLIENGYCLQMPVGWRYEDDIIIEAFEQIQAADSITGPVTLPRNKQRWFLRKMKGQYDMRQKALRMRKALLKYIDSERALEDLEVRKAVFWASHVFDAEEWLDITGEG